MARKGLLLVTMEPPAAMQEEFNDWYDTEHFPQRCGLPGFESGSRWACLEGFPRWIALYDLESTAALQTPDYLAVSGENSTPWSKRLLPRTFGRQRVIAEQISPGGAVLNAAGIARLLVVRYPASMNNGGDAARVEDLAQSWIGARVFRDTDKSEKGGAVWLIAGFSRPVTLAELSTAIAAGGAADLVNLYAPYTR